MTKTIQGNISNNRAISLDKLQLVQHACMDEANDERSRIL